MSSLKWYIISLFMSLVVGIGIQMVLPFPYGLAAALVTFIVTPLLIRNRYMNRHGESSRHTLIAIIFIIMGFGSFAVLMYSIGLVFGVFPP